MMDVKKPELDAFVYQGKLIKDVVLDFGNGKVTLGSGVEYVITVVKKSD